MQRLSKLSLIGPFTPGASVLSRAESVRAARANCCLSAIHRALTCSHCDGPVRAPNAHPSLNSWTEAPSCSSKGAANILPVDTSSHVSPSQSTGNRLLQLTQAKKPRQNSSSIRQDLPKVPDVNVQFPSEQDPPDLQLGVYWCTIKKKKKNSEKTSASQICALNESRFCSRCPICYYGCCHFSSRHREQEDSRLATRFAT